MAPRVESEVPNDFTQQAFVVLNLHTPDFTTAARLAAGINNMLGADTAQAMDAVSVKVAAPSQSQPAHRLPVGAGSHRSGAR